MLTLSTRAAAKRLGIAEATLSQYIKLGKVPTPKSVSSGGMTIHLWTEEGIEQVRKLLPKIANGRKARYQKLRGKQGTQPRAAALPKKRKTKKK